MRDVVYLHRESEAITRAALDQRSTSANESVEEAWRISCAPRVNCLVLRENYELLLDNHAKASGSLHWQLIHIAKILFLFLQKGQNERFYESLVQNNGLIIVFADYLYIFVLNKCETNIKKTDTDECVLSIITTSSTSQQVPCGLQAMWRSCQH